MNNPFHDTLRLEDGRNENFGSLAKQGAHSLSIADVDGDGCHEIIYGRRPSTMTDPFYTAPGRNASGKHGAR